MMRDKRMDTKSSKKKPDERPAPAPAREVKDKRLHLRPAEDKRRPGKRLHVRDTRTGVVLPEGGARVASHIGWIRALRCGDVEKV